MKKSDTPKPHWFDNERYDNSTANRYIIAFPDSSIENRFDDQITCLRILFDEALILSQPSPSYESESWFTYLGGHSGIPSTETTQHQATGQPSCAQYVLKSSIDRLYSGNLLVGLDEDKDFILNLFALVLKGTFHHPPVFYSLDALIVAYFHPYNEVGLFVHPKKSIVLERLLAFKSVQVLFNNRTVVSTGFESAGCRRVRIGGAKTDN